MKIILCSFFISLSIFVFGQNGYWQQHADYTMQIDFDAVNGRFNGTQKLVYTNNSPDTLKQVFYHLYYNAFQPGSQMDIRNYTIKDSDNRIGSKITYLVEEDMGYHKIISLKQDGTTLNYHVEGTILEVDLDKAILPGTSTTFDMEFKSQVPLITRRTGKYNSEGIDFSMAQWYPKMAEYDRDGWHADEYIAREFYGVWGNFNVEITIDTSYTIAGTGYLQNPEEIGHGYAENNSTSYNGKNTWKFFAPQVHDFLWAADPDYKHDIITLRDDLKVHFFYQTDTLTKNWDSLQYYIQDVFAIMDTTFGKYPYKQYSFIQGGDGGMEYPMSTLIVGHNTVDRFIATAVHEMIHNWYYGVLASNENSYAWMDEGFTSYAEDFVMDIIMPDSLYGPRLGYASSYLKIVDYNLQENLTTPADFYNRNYTYYSSVYTKGTLFLNQLRYIVGDDIFYHGLRRYFSEWKFKHPMPKDYLRIMEKEANMELDWFFHHWIESTNTIDYGIKSLVANKKESKLVIQRIGKIPMPLEVSVLYNDGRKELYYIPLRIMRGEKVFPKDVDVKQLADWPWTYPDYEITIPEKLENIVRVEIDENQLMVDIERKNNIWKNSMTNTVFQPGE